MNLQILSRIITIVLVCLSGLRQEGELPRVDTPQSGEQVHGEVIVSGSTAISGFSHTEVHFAFPEGDTWFLIQSSDQPVRNGPIATWDTTSIVDGVYRLRVTVFLVDGSYTEVVVSDLKVANHAAGATQAIPGYTTPTIMRTGGPEITPSIMISTATPFPENPAEVSTTGLWTVMLVSGLGILFIFVIWFGIKRIFFKRDE
jgi:hypothetical protein